MLPYPTEWRGPVHLRRAPLGMLRVRWYFRRSCSRTLASANEIAAQLGLTHNAGSQPARGDI
jgi:hypothetical protein